MPSFEIPTDIFISFERIWRAFRRTKCKNTSKISADISKDVTLNSIYLKPWHSQLTFLIDCGRQYPCAKFHVPSFTNNRDHYWGGGGEEGMNPSRTPLTRTLRGSRKWFDKVGVRYIVEVYWGKWNQREIQTIRYSGGSLYPVFDIAEFDCMTFQTWRYCFSKREWICPEWGGGEVSFNYRPPVCMFTISSQYVYCMFTISSQYIHCMFTVCSLYIHHV